LKIITLPNGYGINLIDMLNVAFTFEFTINQEGFPGNHVLVSKSFDSKDFEGSPYTERLKMIKNYYPPQ